MCSAHGDSISAASVAQNNITSDMNKHQRQSRQPADRTTLPDDVAGELSHIATEVIDVGDAPPIAPRAPLTQDEVEYHSHLGNELVVSANGKQGLK